MDCSCADGEGNSYQEEVVNSYQEEGEIEVAGEKIY